MVRRFDKAKPKPPNSKTSLHLRIRIETFQHSGVGYTILHHQTQQTIRMSAHASVLDKPTPEEFVWSYAFRHEVWPTQTSCTIYRGNPSKIDPQKKHIIYIYAYISKKWVPLNNPWVNFYTKTWFPTWPLSLRSPPPTSPHSQPGVGFPRDFYLNWNWMKWLTLGDRSTILHFKYHFIRLYKITFPIWFHLLMDRCIA